MLGNLTLLEKTPNASIRNEIFSVKLPAYKESAFYLTKSIGGLTYMGENTAINRMNENLKSWDVWNKDTIVDRQEMLFNLSKMVWDINNL